MYVTFFEERVVFSSVLVDLKIRGFFEVPGASFDFCGVLKSAIYVSSLKSTNQRSTNNSLLVGSSPSRSDNVIKETGVFQTYSIAFSRFSNFHREFSNFPIAFCNVFSKINLINIVSKEIKAEIGEIIFLSYFLAKSVISQRGRNWS